jgi:three-Cys-motif partner protein
MGLEFVGEAISLSGLTGSKLKSEIIGEYYPFWWRITSGGESNRNQWPTAIIELDAASGEMYIKDTHETILGSSGHALSLKLDNLNTEHLKIICVEKNRECFEKLRAVIAKRWPKVNLTQAEGPFNTNRTNIYLLNTDLDDALGKIARLELGNSLFFFDPLRSVPFDTINKVAKARIKNYYQTGTEFMVFVFTSDWFLGRDEFVGLPKTNDEENWSISEKSTVEEADSLFGDTNWRAQILNNKPIYEREKLFIELYKASLHRWFRYVLPMPFNPKANQLFHLILCSNYEAGVQATKGFFCERTHNIKFKPDNKQAFINFRVNHAELFAPLKGNTRPKQWRILWTTLIEHEEGYCDLLSKDFKDIEPSDAERLKLLEWLEGAHYLVRISSQNPWNIAIARYKINWEVVKQKLGVEPPQDLKPLSLKALPIEEINQC